MNATGARVRDRLHPRLHQPLVSLLRAGRRAAHAARRPALRRLVRGLDPRDPLSSDVAARLVRAWGITGSADADFIVEVAARARAAPGPILECGSGLTSLVAGVYAQHGIWSLEHHAGYRRGVERALATCGVAGVRLLHAPLEGYDGFDWYRVPSSLPELFVLVICDGPPSDTRGGRIGLLPVLHSKLAPGCIVLLDDARRSGEQAAIMSWTAEYGMKALDNGDARYVIMLRGPEGTPSGP